ncbi:hypothetical protein DB346_20445 [Verrucomicrobia bacterium LW23]|nr:hypothetical protein DB346_20445 [Verrucomicrobia bacterium LW23]
MHVVIAAIASAKYRTISAVAERAKAVAALALAVGPLLACGTTRCLAQTSAPAPEPSLIAPSTDDNHRDGATPARTFAIGRTGTDTPRLDGELSDWPADTARFLLGAHTQTGRRFSWGGTQDISGAVRMAWNETHLFLAVTVTPALPIASLSSTTPGSFALEKQPQRARARVLASSFQTP